MIEVNNRVWKILENELSLIREIVPKPKIYNLKKIIQTTPRYR